MYLNVGYVQITMTGVTQLNDLTVGSEMKLIFKFALPMLIGNIFQQLYSTVDSIIVGQTLGKDALAAVGASFPIILLVVSLILGVTMGSTILISQYYGSKDIERVKRTIDTTYVFLFFASVIMTIVGLVVSEPLLKMLKVPEELMADAKSYLNITFIGLIGMFGYNSVSAILRGIGDSVTSLYFLIIATIINIGLDLLFIITFNWGVAGAAWATIIAQTLSFVLSMIYLNSKNEFFKFSIANIKFDKTIMKLLIRVGLPAGIQQVFLSSGIMALQGIVNGFGSNVIAAFTAAARLDSFATMPVSNFANALSSFVGQNVGAGKMERVKKGYGVTIGMSVLFSLSITLIFFIFGRPLMSIFVQDAIVIDEGVKYLNIVSSGYALLSILFVTAGLIRGTGNSIFPMFMTIASLWVVRVPVAAILSRPFGTTGLWLGIPIGWLLGAIVGLVYYFSGRWKKKILLQQ